MDSTTHGTFIVIEGSDGSGKGTQFRLLKERLTAVGYDVEVFDFPRYEQDSSYFVKQYLNGQYGPAKNVSPYTASIFYALDRYEAAPKIREALEAGKIVLCNRYVGSNMAHQGGKFNDPIEQRSFFVWEDSLEYQLLSIPRPTLNIFLRVPAETAQELVAKKQARNYTNKSHDEHEADLSHLKKSVETYDLLCKLFPNDFKPIDCVNNGQLMSIPDINNQIWELVKPLLPEKPSLPAHSVVVKLHEQPKSNKNAGSSADSLDYQGNLSLLAAWEAKLAGLELGSANHSWHDSEYKYFIPDNLSKKTLAKYKQYMDRLVDLHLSLAKKLDDSSEARQALLSATPLAAIANFKVAISAAELARLAPKLAYTRTGEVARLAEALNSIGRRSSPELLKDNFASSSGKVPESINKILERLAAEHLPQNLTAPVEPVQLMEAWPRNEFKVLVDSIYSLSNLSKIEIEEELDSWSYQQKSDALSAAIQAKNGEAVDKLRYQFDITADRLLIEQILDSRLALSAKIQPATPRYGYDVPKIVDKAETIDEYLECFDKSLELFSALQAAEHEELAPYATLLGHKLRFQLDCSLKSVMGRLSAKNSPELARLLSAMIEQIGVRHPIAMAGLVKGQISVDKKEEKKSEPAPKATKKSSAHRSRGRRGRKPKK